MPKNWAKGLTKETDERIALAAQAHVGLKYKKKVLKNGKFSWTSELAYAVGLITTDGNLSKDGRHLEFTSKDLDQIRTFKNCLEIEVKISSKTSGYTKKRNSFHIQFWDTAFYRWLLRIGLSPAKTKTIGVLKIPKKYFFDFLRGHLDGDGYIYFYKDTRWKNSWLIYTTFLSYSLNHLKWIRNEIWESLSIKGTLNKNQNVWYLRYAKRESLRLLSKLYYDDDIPCLKRKRDVFYKFIDQAEVSEQVDDHA